MRKRLQVDLSNEDYARLVCLADGHSLSDLLRRALNTEAYLLAQEQAGAKILIEELGGSTRELVRF
jgi:hypothetical protein